MYLYCTDVLHQLLVPLVWMLPISKNWIRPCTTTRKLHQITHPKGSKQVHINILIESNLLNQ